MEAVSTVFFSTAAMVVDRFMIFSLHLPLMVGLLFILVVDGLVQRDIRKFQGARESTFFFHRIKPLTGKIFTFLFLIYLALPFPGYAEIILFPMMLILSIMAMISIKSYKKYA